MCKSLLAPHLSNNKSLKVFTQNIRSITKNFSQFEVFLCRLQITCDIIILTESWNSKVLHYPSLKNYNTHFSKINKNQNDGIVVYTKDDLSYSVEEVLLLDATCLVIDVDDDSAVIAIYRSPSYLNIENFLNSLDNLLNKLKNRSNIIIMGDLNIDVKSDNVDRNSTNYLNLLASHGFLAGHVFPTRDQNCLDHAMIKASFSSITLVLNSSLTDHAPVLSCVKKVNKIKTINQKTFKKVNYEKIVTDINSTNFNIIFNSSDVNFCVQKLVSTLSILISNNTLKVLVPKRQRCIKPWITPGLIRCIINRDRMHLRYKKEPGNVILSLTYRRYKNHCNNLLKRLKRNYYKNELNKHAKDPKMKWKVVNNITNRETKKSSSSELLKVESTPEKSLEKINLFFTNIAKDLASKINTVSNQVVEAFCPPVESMVMFETNEPEVESMIMSLRTDAAMGWDGIPTKVIKMAKNTIIPILTHIINLSIQTGIFPDLFKISVVHPVHKSGNRDCVNNFRPISILPVLSKVLEKVMKKRLLSYLEEQKILASNQYGFRTNRSTTHAVSALTNAVARKIDEKHKCIGVFLDLAKAFDTVSVPILTHKMEKIGIRGKTLKLYSDYLTNRKQRTTIDGHFSSDSPISFGVPQGSVLGPSLFLIYINNLCKLELSNCEIFAYADDTALIFYGKTWEEVKHFTEAGLHKISIWLRQNLLTMNITKTNFIAFANTEKTLKTATDLSLQIHSCQKSNTVTCTCNFLNRVKTVKYLGILLDEKLTWCPYIDLLTGRTRKLIYVFKKLRHVADITILKTVYFALAQSILTYCNTSWDGARKTHLIKLERSQRALLKVMTFRPYKYPTNDLYYECDVLTVRQLFVKQIIMTQHHKLKYDAKLAVKRRVGTICPINRYNTRFVEKFECYLGPMLYNKLNKIINIYPLNNYLCQKALVTWLKSQKYEDVENLFPKLY